MHFLRLSLPAALAAWAAGCGTDPAAPGAPVDAGADRGGAREAAPDARAETGSDARQDPADASDAGPPRDAAPPRDTSAGGSATDTAEASVDGARLPDSGADGALDAAFPEVHFTDVTASAGLARVQGPATVASDCGLLTVEDCPPQLTGGAAAADVDGDGRLDLYVTHFGEPDSLYRNRGDGTFEDIAASAGLTGVLKSNGCGFGDVDNDGDPDLYVTAVDDLRFYLFINDGTGHFEEQGVARGAALASDVPHFGFSVSFGDFDRDGFLDIHTTEWRHNARVPPGAPSYTRLLKNRGTSAPGHFDDVTVAAGVDMDNLQLDGDWGFSSSFSDLDGDGWPDLAVAADFGTSRLFWNSWDGTFSDGTTWAEVGTESNGMGHTLGDYDGDGDLDWFVTSIFCDDSECHLGANGNRLYSNDGDRTFTDVTDAAGVRNGRWGWGTAFFDADNDGDLDLTMTNGVDFTDELSTIFHTDRARLWLNEGGVFSEQAGPAGIDDPGNGKGVLVFDYDADGDLDLFTTRRGQTPILYRNDTAGAGDFLRVRLHGTRSNRQGFGARLTLRARAGATPQVRELVGGSHYLTQSEPVVHFGLGRGGAAVEELRIRWPGSGEEQVLRAIDRNQTLDVTEP